MVSTSFPLQPQAVSGIFVRHLADAIALNADLVLLTPQGKTKQTFFPKEYTAFAFPYAPKSLQLLTHTPGGIPSALKHVPILWAIVPLLLGAMAFNVFKHSKNCQIIHSNWTAPGIIGGLIGFLRRKHSIVTLRGTDVNGFKRSRLKRTTLSLALRFNNIVVTVSEAMRADLISEFPHFSNKIHFIPNGVAEEFFIDEKPFTPPLRLLFIGNLVTNKGCDVAIAALHNANISNDVCLTIVGDGPEFNKLLDQTKAFSLAHRVNFAGRVAPEKIPDILLNHDILLLPSWEEGRPNVVIEAMAAGKTIIASNLPVLNELITDGKSGFIFPRGNPHALSSLIEHVHSDPTILEEIGRQARNSIYSLDLTWAACAKKYLALYRQLLEGRR